VVAREQVVTAAVDEVGRLRDEFNEWVDRQMEPVEALMERTFRKRA
jgi:hypothetical protein